MAKSPDVVDALRTVPLFAGLDKRALQRMAERVKPVEHAAGKEIAAEGASGVAFHLVQTGSVEVEVKGSVVRTLGPGDHFGELSLIDGKPRSATVRAVENTTTLTMVGWEFRPLLDDVEITRALLVSLVSRLRDAESR
ncbi:MAG: cyclic nucleotide-binding protein [Frankiales bacterium]|jgi:CRP/FNR family cyclic AMP-dependent transcriptional regulator|nr:cyclic nucleotide-binding protein [Frankiales bacterium]